MSPSKTSPRLLIAEDNESMLQFIQVALTLDLRSADWHVDYARDGREALAKYLQAKGSGTPYTLLLLDNDMPHMSGPQVALEVRRGGDWDVAAVIYSAHMERLSAQVRHEAGIARELQKHHIICDLVSHLERLLETVCAPSCVVAPPALGAECSSGEVLPSR